MKLNIVPIFTMGFPKPISGMTEQTEEGLMRQIYWQRDIHFRKNYAVQSANTVGMDLSLHHNLFQKAHSMII